MEPIDEKVKEAWRYTDGRPIPVGSSETGIALMTFRDAYVHERAMRVKAEHYSKCLIHIGSQCLECEKIDADWEASVRKELEGEK